MQLVERLQLIEAGSSMIFVGGSTDTPDEVVRNLQIHSGRIRTTGVCIKPRSMSEEEKWKIRIVLFPGGAHALSPAAGGITL